MIDCPDFLDRYSDFRDQLLDSAETAAFEGHLAACASCARYDRVVAGGIETLLRLPEVTPSPDFADRLDDRLSAVQLMEGSTSSGAPVALVIAVAATIGAAAWLPAMRVEPQPMRLPPTFAHAPYHPQLIPTVMQPTLLAVPATNSPHAVRYRAPGFAAYSLLGTQTTQAPALVARAGR
jgi:hypothetical protein